MKHQKTGKEENGIEWAILPEWEPVKCRTPENDIQINSMKEKKITNGFKVEGKRFAFMLEITIKS